MKPATVSCGQSDKQIRTLPNMQALYKKYHTDLMVVETGMECADGRGKLVTPSQLAESKRQFRLPKADKRYRFLLAFVQSCMLSDVRHYSGTDSNCPLYQSLLHNSGSD